MTLRIVVHHGEIHKSALIDAVAEREHGKPVQGLTDRERKRVQVSLSQAHLPKLAEYDAVVLDGDVVRPGGAASRVLGFDGDTRSGCLLKRVASAFR